MTAEIHQAYEDQTTNRIWAPNLNGLPAVVNAPRTDAIYNCHSYLTKVPVGAIRPFIEAFTKPGEIVADLFAGSGMTGLAAAISGRVGTLSDISVLGQHIGTGYLTQVGPDGVRKAARDVVTKARRAIGDLYQTKRHSDGEATEMVRTIWSFVYMCPKCSNSLVYFEHLDAAGRPPKTCTKCPHPFARRTWPRTGDVPVRVVVNGAEGKQVEQMIQPSDAERIERAGRDPRQERVPSLKIDASREMYGRSGLGRVGISETKQFFSARNAIVLLEIWNAIAEVDDPRLRQKLRFAFTASLARASRRYQWGPKRPLNAQNQTYYVAPVYFEWNVFELFERKVEAGVRSDQLLFDQAPLFLRSFAEKATYHIASAANLEHLRDGSVDYVFTDPPFGSNIFYADMNLFHEAWLGKATNDANEAVMHTSGPKRTASAGRYEKLLSEAFREAFRVLRPGRHMSVVFGNSSGNVWSLVQRAMRDAGFSSPLHVAILDKGQRSVKGLNSGSEGVVTVDLILTVRKPDRGGVVRHENGGTHDIHELLRAATKALKADETRNPSYVYAALLREAIHRGHDLDGLHYSDILVLLRSKGFDLDAKTGLLNRAVGAALA